MYIYVYSQLHIGYMVCMLIMQLVAFTSTGPYYTFAYLFRPTTSKVWCRTSCEDIAPENITWCVNIASFENDVETCISLNNATHKVITNSSCEAEVIQLPDYLSLPTVSSTASIVYWYDSFLLNFRTVLCMAMLDVWGSLAWTGSLRVHI